jgi:hypothetical protein
MLSLPLPLKLLLYCLVMIGTAVVLLEHANKWASSLQQYYIRAAKAEYGDGPRVWEWERPWAWYIGKCGIIFSTVVIVTGVVTLIFGPF